ncbi:MAG: hypothetical protein ACI9CO_002148, partial [Candidatus Azotimanducaceae bacterium]
MLGLYRCRGNKRTITGALSLAELGDEYSYVTPWWQDYRFYYNASSTFQ